MIDDSKPVLAGCASCGGQKRVSPMVIFWGGDPSQACPECRGAGLVEVCRVCRGEGTREPDPGEPPPPVGLHKCRGCHGWGTLGPVPAQLEELGVPDELGWLMARDKQGRAHILHMLECDLSQRQYLFCRAVRKGFITREYADILAPGWENNVPEETANAESETHRNTVAALAAAARHGPGTPLGVDVSVPAIWRFARWLGRKMGAPA